MKNPKLFIGIASLAVIATGAYLTREKWMPLFQKPITEEKPAEGDLPDLEEKPVVEKTAPPPTPTAKGVYAKYKNTEIKLADKGNTSENIIVLGKAVRKTEGVNESLGKFIKYITIFATPFVLFTDSYSGRNVLVAKSAVNIK